MRQRWPKRARRCPEEEVVALQADACWEERGLLPTAKRQHVAANMLVRPLCQSMAVEASLEVGCRVVLLLIARPMLEGSRRQGASWPECAC